MNKYVGRICGVALLSGVLVSVQPLSLFAAPAFARSNEEWERLRDNTLEYGELQGLIEEYNATVKNSEGAYIQFRKDYGSTNASAKEHYQKAAADIMGSLSDPDPDSPAYISVLMANAQAKARADQLLKSADESLEDALLMKLNHDMTAMTLVWNAQNNMIAYYTGDIEWQKAKLQKEFALAEAESADLNLSLGMGTRVELLQAQEAVLKSEQEILNTANAKETSKKKLQVMTGWSYEALPEIGALPEPNLEKISSYQPQQDLEKALQNNYSLQVYERKLQNAVGEDTKEELRNSIASARSNIGISLNNAHANVLAAKEVYDYALSNAVLMELQLSQAQAKHAAGSLSAKALQQAVWQKDLAILTGQSAEYGLFSAMQAYEWNVNGLASTGQ